MQHNSKTRFYGSEIEDRSLGMISRHIAASPFFAFSQVFHVGVANGRRGGLRGRLSLCRLEKPAGRLGCHS